MEVFSIVFYNVSYFFSIIIIFLLSFSLPFKK